MESKGLNWFVISHRGGQWLAGFQYKEWAEQWRNSHCATGLVVSQSEWMTIQLEVMKEQAFDKLGMPIPNGGIQ